MHLFKEGDEIVITENVRGTTVSPRRYSATGDSDSRSSKRPQRGQASLAEDELIFVETDRRSSA
jgi:hypothetical protein